MKHRLNDHEDRPNHENLHKLCDETGYRIISLAESHWKLRQHDQNLSIEGKPLQTKY